MTKTPEQLKNMSSSERLSISNAMRMRILEGEDPPVEEIQEALRALQYETIARHGHGSGKGKAKETKTTSIEPKLALSDF